MDVIFAGGYIPAKELQQAKKAAKDLRGAEAREDIEAVLDALEQLANPMGGQELRRVGTHLLEIEYLSDVDAMVADIAPEVLEEAVDSGDPEGFLDMGAWSDRIHESVDGSEWVIYTWRAEVVLCFSKFLDAADEDADRSLEARAYGAMCADVGAVAWRLTAEAKEAIEAALEAAEEAAEEAQQRNAIVAKAIEDMITRFESESR